jgi:two-component system sensor histidine kinase YesM
MQLLQAQIKPHFLFNTLMSIRCAIGNGNTEKASHMTLALSSFLRNTIVRGEEIVTLKEELDIIHTYIQIQNDRSYQKVTFRTDIQDGLETFKIPKLLLQPLIENSISHGFYEQETGEILLSAKRKQDQVLITVKDNGKGFEINPLEYSRQEQHFGVYSVKHRLKIYYGEQGSIQYQSSNGTTVIISLPISDKEGQEACGTY